MRSLMAAPTFLALHVPFDWPHDCSNRGVEEIIRWLTTNHFSSREAGYIASNQAIPIEQAKNIRLIRLHNTAL